MNKQVLIFIPVFLIIASGSFFGGIQFEKSQSKTSTPNFQNFQNRQGEFSQNGQNSTRKNSSMGGFVNGQIISIDGTSITVKLQNGGSKIVLLSDVTKVLKSTETSKSDLVKDLNIMVTGKTNNDGTVTAESIQIRTDVPQEQQPPVSTQK